jgi:transcriptional regulator with XRE-family HTH domain
MKHKLTQEEIASLEMGVRVYQRIENGNGSPSLKSIFFIAKSLKLHPKDLFDFPVKYDD